MRRELRISARDRKVFKKILWIILPFPPDWARRESYGPEDRAHNKSRDAFQITVF